MLQEKDHGYRHTTSDDLGAETWTLTKHLAEKQRQKRKNKCNDQHQKYHSKGWRAREGSEKDIWPECRIPSGRKEQQSGRPGKEKRSKGRPRGDGGMKSRRRVETCGCERRKNPRRGERCGGHLLVVA